MSMRYIKYISTGFILFIIGVLIVGCSGSGFTIGVVTGTTFEKKAEEFSKVKDVRLYEDDNMTLLDLSNGRIDGVITDRLVGLNSIQKGGFDNLRLAGDFLYTETIGVAVRQGDDSLRQAINKALEDMIADGTYANISTEYFGRNILDGIDYKKTFTDEEPASDNSLQRVKDAGEISFAMSGGYPPFNYFTENDELTGFDVDIGKEVAKRLGVEYKPVTTDWGGILEGLRSGRYDGIFGSMAITEERLEVVDFTDPYYYSGAQLIVREESSIKSADDLK